MAIQNVKVTINGQQYTLTYNGSSGKYEKTITAPSITSFNQAGGYYSASVVATDVAGNTASVDGSTDSNCRLTVKETVPPTITITAPSGGATVTTAGPTITGELRDEVNGSGVDTDNFILKIDDVPVSNAGATFTPVSGGYDFSYTASGLTDGGHIIKVDVKDNDGNSATQATASFTVDTTVPSLNISNPSDGEITNQASLSVQGTTSDVTSNPITVTVKLNGVDQGEVVVSEGAFSKAVTLAEGSNSIVVRSTDSAGLYSEVTRNVTLDTQDPIISLVEIVPNPVDAGQTYIIKVTATD